MNAWTYASLLVLSSATVSAQDYAITWYSIDAGAATSTSGSLVLDATIGQPDAGELTSARFSLSTGFWAVDAPEPCSADLDGDGDADADDFFTFLDAFATGDVRICDIDGDIDCDANDFFGYLDRFAAGC